MGQVLKLSSCKLQGDTKPCHSQNTIFLLYGRDPYLPLHQLLELHAIIPRRHMESGLLNLEAHYLALANTKKTLDENLLQNCHRKQQIENHHHSR